MCESSDPLKDLYKPLSEIKIMLNRTILLIIDMQYLDAAEGYGCFKNISSQAQSEAAGYYFSRIRDVVLPNIKKLQEVFRSKNMEVVFTVIESLTNDGRDRSLQHKRLALLAPKGSKEAQILDDIRPVGDEIIISKTASGVFDSTNIDYVLRNLGIDTLVVAGVVTNECVENTVRGASDRSYNVIVVEDCCAALSKEVHDNALSAMEKTYARVLKTEELLNNIE